MTMEELRKKNFVANERFDIAGHESGFLNPHGGKDAPGDIPPSDRWVLGADCDDSHEIIRILRKRH